MITLVKVAVEAPNKCHYCKGLIHPHEEQRSKKLVVRMLRNNGDIVKLVYHFHKRHYSQGYEKFLDRPRWIIGPR